MRRLDIGSNRYSEVIVKDEPEFNANNEYSICRSPAVEGPLLTEFGFVKFQKGPVKEQGVNGCHNEDLLIIVLDRLQSFQGSSFACRENALAITKIEEALHWLNHRTAARKKRGVEGKNIV